MSGVSPRSAQGHVLVADLGQPVLTDADRHHLLRVMRLRDGDVVTATDGRGRWRVCLLRSGELEPEGAIVAEPAALPPITVAFAPVKGDRPEWVVQKLTEIGVERVVPMRCDRSVVRWDTERASRQVERLRRVVHEAVMQSRRVWVPEVGEVTPFAEMLAEGGACLAEPGGDPPGIEHAVALIGPEGGWSPAELAAAEVVGAPRIGLGPHVLRAETAAVVAGALLVASRAARR